MATRAPTAQSFGTICRTLTSATRRCGLDAPSFRSPPRLPGADRTLRRRGDGSAVVAVTRRSRPVAAVVADLIEGVVVANGLQGGEAIRTRSALWEAVTGVGAAEAA